MDVATAARFSEGIACFTGDLAALALDRRDWPEAETLARKALLLSKEVGREELIAKDKLTPAEMTELYEAWLFAEDKPYQKLLADSAATYNVPKQNHGLP